MYNPTEPWQDNVGLESTSGAIVRLVGVRVHTRPVLGEALAARLTVPVKPLRDLTVIVELPVAFGSSGGTVLGFEVMLKSTNVKVAVAPWVDEPGEPFAVIGTLKVPAFDDEQLSGILFVPLGGS